MAGSGLASAWLSLAPVWTKVRNRSIFRPMGRPVRNVRISENFVPVSEFKAQAAAWLRKAGETGAPVVVTQNGKPAGVLLSPEAFDELTEQARFVAAVEEGLADSDAARVHSHSAVARRMQSRFGDSGE